jgi:hypothetical protein
VINDDYILRMVRQVTEMIGRLVGLRQEQRFDEAEQTVTAALDGLFGPLSRTLDELTPASVVSLVAKDEKLRLYATLLRERALIANARGDFAGRDALARRAAAITSGTQSSSPPSRRPDSSPRD